MHRTTEEALIDMRHLFAQAGPGFSLRIPDFQVFPGELTVILGANGSGKSTLLSCLLASDLMREGEVFLLGLRPGRLGLAQRRRLGVQWQGAGFNELYLVRDIQELHRRCYPQSDISVFDAFGLPELARKRFGRLSSGEQQRVQLAMAFAHHPQLMIFDEPTSNLDPHYEDVFCRALTARRREDAGFASLCVTHSQRVAALHDRVLLLERGGIDAAGSLKDLVQQRFYSVGCRIVATPSKLDTAQALFSQASAPRLRRHADTLTVYGDITVRVAAQRFAAEHDLDEFSLWRPSAADLLEEIKRG